ncbi:MAG: hypothetical protein LH629_04245 [Ignavibacteria bacterium]|nr:hypothetical protein [Ignavibacteria bacterium]
MKTKITFFIFAIIIITTSGIYSQWKYPATPTVDSTETYFGVTFNDPYQWLENIESPEVKDWFKEEPTYSDNVIDKIPNREKIVNELLALDKIKKVKYSSIREKAGKYFFEKRLPGEEASKMFYRNGINGEDILLFDPLTYIPGKKYTLGGWDVSNSGENITIDITESGKETSFIKILNVDSKTFYSDEILIASAYG